MPRARYANPGRTLVAFTDDEGVAYPVAPGDPRLAGLDIEPPAATPAQAEIPALDFLQRFTPAEQTAVQQACLTNPLIALGLTMGLARGQINLASTTLTQWMAALVQAGAITEARRAEIVEPIAA